MSPDLIVAYILPTPSGQPCGQSLGKAECLNTEPDHVRHEFVAADA